MKLKANEIKPNEFKKEINNGVLNREQVEKIKATINDLGLMGALPVYRKGEHYHLVAGHHRLQAAKEVYGNNCEIEVVVHKFDEEAVLRGMIVENLTHRRGEFGEEKENLLLAQKWLQKNVAVHSVNSKRKDGQDARPQNMAENGSVRDIAAWLNKKGEIMAIGKIQSILSIAKNLSPELLARVGKATTTSIDAQDDIIPVKTAEILAKLPSHEEQEAMAGILLNTDEFSSNLERSEAITVYNSLTPEDKESVLSGELSLGDIKKGERVLGRGEMALKFHEMASGLVVEMRDLSRTLGKFRKDDLFSSFSPKERKGFAGRLDVVRKEYTVLMDELTKSIEVLNHE